MNSFPLLRSIQGTITALVCGLLASCSEQGSEAASTSDHSEGPVQEKALPADMKLVSLVGSTVNLANKVTPQGDLFFTMLDTTSTTYTLYRFNIFTKEQKTLARLNAKLDRGGILINYNVRAILDVVVNGDKVMLVSELQYQTIDQAIRSDYIVDVLDMYTGELVEEREMFGSGAVQSSVRSPLAGWISQDGTPVVYHTFREERPYRLPRMASDIGNDRYEFMVEEDEANYNLKISCVPYDTVQSHSRVQWDRGVRLLRSVYNAPLTALSDYGGYYRRAGAERRQRTWAGSQNAIQMGNRLYFMLHDVLLALRNGQVERVASLNLGEKDKLEGHYFPRFIAPQDYQRSGALVDRDLSGYDGSIYRKLYSVGTTLFVGVDGRRLYAYDMNSAQGKFIPLDTSACPYCGPSEFFIGESSIWQLHPTKKGKDLLNFDRSGNLIDRYPVRCDGYEVMEGVAQVLALEDRANGNVTLYLMQPVTTEQLAATAYGYNSALSTDDEPVWRDEEALHDTILDPYWYEQP